ncbi:MAG: tetraacyldisaccharide 4'-kinase [Candidatus Marinimicrobia bacterium]|nr:tetraacyldisaccharide 4'-kinase [Candidatus Neomarinimicrobiota bacterium]
MNIILNIILFPLFMIYLLIIVIRNYLFDIKLFKSTQLPCKVISVGNITVGGTGKTPIVIAIAKFLLQQNKTVAVLSRGYGRKSTGTQLVTNSKTSLTSWKNVGDEPTLMAKHLQGIPIVVDENRIRGGKYLIDKFHPEIIILDDGFQHRKISRDVDIVLVNSNMSKYKNRIFGFRTFREPWKSLSRAHLIFLTKSDFVTPSSKILERLKKIDLPFFNANINPSSYLLDYQNNKIDLDYFDGKTALLFSGIGDPESFGKTVQSLNIRILNTIKFGDHKNYSKSDIKLIRNKYINSGADVILTTEKDFLKIAETNLPIYTIPITMNVDEKGFEHILKHLN